MLGFVILSHKEPHQLARLAVTLTRLFGQVPIVCHHDSSQSEIEKSRFPPNVTFVEPSVRTGWAKWSVVEASIEGIRKLYERSDPSWFALMSSADYPVMNAQSVYSDLEATSADVLMDYRPVPKTGTPDPIPGTVDWLAHHGNENNIELARLRYRRALLKYPVIRRSPPQFSTSVQKSWRLGRSTIALPFEPLSSPYRESLGCYVGSQWFTANRRAARLIVEPDVNFLTLEKYLRGRIVPDENFFHSLFCNDPALRVDPNPRRYAQWNSGGAHPQDLTCDTIAPALESGAHFARKFAPDAPVLDELDALLFA
jgi:hypothetical protein